DQVICRHLATMAAADVSDRCDDFVERALLPSVGGANGDPPLGAVAAGQHVLAFGRAGREAWRDGERVGSLVDEEPCGVTQAQYLSVGTSERFVARPPGQTLGGAVDLRNRPLRADEDDAVRQPVEYRFAGHRAPLAPCSRPAVIRPARALAPDLRARLRPAPRTQPDLSRPYPRAPAGPRRPQPASTH